MTADVVNDRRAGERIGRSGAIGSQDARATARVA